MEETTPNTDQYRDRDSFAADATASGPLRSKTQAQLEEEQRMLEEEQEAEGFAIEDPSDEARLETQHAANRPTIFNKYWQSL